MVNFFQFYGRLLFKIMMDKVLERKDEIKFFEFISCLFFAHIFLETLLLITVEVLKKKLNM